MVPYASINEKAPFTTAFRSQGQVWMAVIVGFGSLMGIFDTIIVVQYSMSRTFVMLGRMGLVPPMLVSRCSQRVSWILLYCIQLILPAAIHFSV